MTGPRVSYSPEELAFIEQRKHLPRLELHDQFVRRFARTDVTVSLLIGLRRRMGWSNGNKAAHGYVSKDGYCCISVRQTDPRTGFKRLRHLLKHRLLWEQMHGPVPDGMVLKCKGDKLNVDPSNWELIPRELLPRLNLHGRGYDVAPDELKPTIMAVAKLEHSVHQKTPHRC